jgi:hypothetical protein
MSEIQQVPKTFPPMRKTLTLLQLERIIAISFISFQTALVFRKNVGRPVVISAFLSQSLRNKLLIIII